MLNSGPSESHLFLLVQHNCNCMKHESLSHPYAQGPKGENVGSITQPLPSNYLIFRAASESDGESGVHLHQWEVYDLTYLIHYFHSQDSLFKVFISVFKMYLSLQAGAGWMPWSWLSAARVSTSWQPKQGGKEISAHRRSPPIYSTCCSLLLSLTRSCYSEWYSTHSAADTDSHSDII